MKIVEAKTKEEFGYIASLFSPSNNKFLTIKNVMINDIMEDSSKMRKYYIINHNNINIGCFNMYTSKDKTSVKIGMIIDKPYQGKGYGSRTIKAIEKIAQKSGIKRIKLEVLRNNRPAINLFNRVGFKKIIEVVYMEKKI